MHSNRLIIAVIVTFFFLSTGCSKDRKSSESTETKKDTAGEQKKEEKNIQPKIGITDTSENYKPIGKVEYGVSKLPDKIKDYDGRVMAMARWSDLLGENIVFITETEVKTSGENRSKELYGYHYVVSDNENKLIWKINDFEKDCPLDIVLKYIDKSLSITDLDRNGVAESSFLYRMACTGDVSPDYMKLIMHEGETKYAIRGQMRLTIKGDKTYGGDMNIDPSFDKGPKEFVDYAKEQWDKFKNVTMGE